MQRSRRRREVRRADKCPSLLLSMKMINKGKLKQRLWNTDKKLWTKEDIKDLIDRMPYMDIVLCHDCLHLIYDKDRDEYVCGLHHDKSNVMIVDYCSAGARRRRGDG